MVDLEEYSPPRFLKIFYLLLIAWSIFGIFPALDPNSVFYVSSGLLLVIIASYSQVLSLRGNTMLESTTFVYVTFWLGITSYQLPGRDFSFYTVTFPIRYFDFGIIFPVYLIWLLPIRGDNFFGLQELSLEEVAHSIWKLSLLILLLIKFFRLPTYLEFSILIPIVLEPIILHRILKTAPPALTLFIQTELTQKFAVPISLIKSALFILIAYMFEYLTLRIWIIFLLIISLVIFIWFIYTFGQSLSPPETTEATEKTVEESVDKHTDKVDTTGQPLTRQPLSSQPTSKLVKSGNKLISKDDNKDSVFAFKLGKKVREEIKKPRYTLNHILANLSKDDFKEGYIVTKDKLTLGSKHGQWNPKKGLLLFPIPLGKFDYRREDEILLIGLQKPNLYGSARFSVSGSKTSKKFSMGKGFIKFGDLTFNLKTLIVNKNDWEKEKSTLTPIDSSIDISHTGFENLDDIQEKLSLIGQKWIELRSNLQLKLYQFLMGLIGAEDAIFQGTPELPNSKNELLEEPSNYDDYEVLE